MKSGVLFVVSVFDPLFFSIKREPEGLLHDIGGESDVACDL